MLIQRDFAEIADHSNSQFESLVFDITGQFINDRRTQSNVWRNLRTNLRNSGSVVIKSVNPENEPCERDAEEVHIIGRIVWAARRL